VTLSAYRLAVPPSPASPLLVVAAGALAGLTGCGATEHVARYAEASRDVLAVAEPCLVEVQRAELRTCAGIAECETLVRQRWAPIATALDVLHEAWCALSPESEGCR
jgi:hypothetical protein